MSIDKQNHILLAEDNEFNQELIVDLLSEAGFLVSTANNGQEVLDLLAQNASDFFQLILMDLEMPVLDGHQATLKIREDGKYQSIPILALTADEGTETKNQCLAEGMQDYLIKPFDPDDLNQTINRWLNSSQQVQHNQPTQQARPKAEAANGLLPQFTTINTERGLHSTSNNPTLYLQLLRRFANTQNTSLQEVEHALTSGIASEEFHRMIHTLKGVSATIGASQIAQLCSQIEVMQEKANEVILPETRQSLQQLNVALKQCREELNLFLKQSPTSVIHPSPSENNAIANHDINPRFLELLQDSSPDALTHFEKHQHYFATIFNNDDYEAMQSAIENYDFDQAICLLNKI